MNPLDLPPTPDTESVYVPIDWNQLLDIAVTGDPHRAEDSEDESPDDPEPEPEPSPSPAPSPVPAVMPPPPGPEEVAAARERAEARFREAEFLEEKARAKIRLKAGREAKRELDEEERAEAAGSAISVERAQPLGEAIFSLATEMPTVWGEGQRVAWAKGQTLMLAAKQGLGKSTLAQNLFMRRIGVVGGDLLGMPVETVEGRALYLGMDRPPQILGSLRRMVTPEEQAVLNERAVFWPGPLPPGLATDPDAFVAWALERAPDCHTVVFDSVKDIMPGISKDEVGYAINALFQVCLINGIEVIAVHHQRKGGSDDGKEKISSLDDVYGSVHMTNGTGSIFTIDGKPGEAQVTLRHLKSALEMLEEFDVLIDFQTGAMTRWDAPVRTVPDVLRSCGNDGITVKEIALLVHHQETKAAQTRVWKVLKKMQEKNGTALCVKPAGGTGAAEPDRWFYVEKPVTTPSSGTDWGAAIDAL